MPDQVDWRTMEREATPGRAVGRLLRDQREALGLSVADIQKRLRIRREYVEAIEQGRFDLLPGAAYIPAFLRAYARDVGLDAEKVLTAYQLSDPVPIERPVALPADFPLVERRAPIGLAVLTVLLVIGAGYGVWHYLPRQQSIVAEKVPPVPDRLLASRPATTREAAPVVTPATTPAPSPVAPLETRSTLPQDSWPAPKLEAVAPPVVVAIPVTPPSVVMSVQGIGQAQAAQTPATEPRVGTPPLSTTTDVQEAVARPAPPAEVVNDPTVPSAPVKFDTQLRVRTNSWIELRAPNGDILAQTYVRAGESYVVPTGISYRVTEAR